MEILERVAVHQTRLRVPGLGLDARGVALGSRGLVLLPSLDRLVAFLAVYSREQSLEPLIDSLRIEVVRSKLGTREVVLGFAASSSDRMDRVSEVARVAGGFTFTGTTRHFVQYRDSTAPFGFDAVEITPTDSPLVLYHSTFSQVYEVERTIEPRRLLLRLTPHADPGAKLGSERVFVLAESGLGPSLVHYLTRSGVDARVGIVEWPPESSFDELPLRRYLFQIESLPSRMRPLLSTTPGVAAFDPVGPGVAVEHGFVHPITLRSVPVFDETGLVLFRGGSPPLVVERVPVLAELADLQQADVALDRPVVGGGAPGPSVDLKVPIRFLPSTTARPGVAATFVPTEQLGLLRRATYLLGSEMLRRTRIAITDRGAFLVGSAEVDTLPIGRFFRQYHSQVFVPSGFDVVPPVAPDLLFELLGAPRDELIFLEPSGAALAVVESAFSSLDAAVVQASRWAPLPAEELAPVLATETPTVWLEPLGINPMSGAKPAS